MKAKNPLAKKPMAAYKAGGVKKAAPKYKVGGAKKSMRRYQTEGAVTDDITINKDKTAITPAAPASPGFYDLAIQVAKTKPKVAMRQARKFEKNNNQTNEDIKIAEATKTRKGSAFGAGASGLGNAFSGIGNLINAFKPTPSINVTPPAGGMKKGGSTIKKRGGRAGSGSADSANTNTTKGQMPPMYNKGGMYKKGGAAKPMMKRATKKK